MTTIIGYEHEQGCVIASDTQTTAGDGYPFTHPDLVKILSRGGYLVAVSGEHPELWFGIRCDEEQGWGVEYEAHDGVLSTTREWDIPTSHADWVELDKEESCICDWEANPTEWYSDCPRKELSETELGKLEDLVESF